jgi:hypothetical protein
MTFGSGREVFYNLFRFPVKNSRFKAAPYQIRPDHHGFFNLFPQTPAPYLFMVSGK